MPESTSARGFNDPNKVYTITSREVEANRGEIGASPVALKAAASTF